MSTLKLIRIMNTNNPIVVGVDIIHGILNVGQLLHWNDNFVGTICNIEFNHQKM